MNQSGTIYTHIGYKIRGSLESISPWSELIGMEEKVGRAVSDAVETLVFESVGNKLDPTEEVP